MIASCAALPKSRCEETLFPAPAAHVRLAGRGKGKSGGYRVVSYFAADDVPVLLLALIDKGERADLSQAERNELRKELQGFADDYRAGVKARIADLRKGRRR